MSARGPHRLVVGITWLGLAVALALLTTGVAQGSPAKDAWSFVSVPGLHPPKLTVLTRRPGLSQGDLLVTSMAAPDPGLPALSERGPMILDSRAQPVWFRRDNDILDFDQDSYQGQPVLVLVGRRVVVLDEHYRTIANLKAHPPWTIDGHDASIIGGDIWVTVVRLVPDNLTPYGGPPDAAVIDCGVQEYELSTGQLIRTWDALHPGGRPNVPLSESDAPIHTQTFPHQSAWDAYHLNAVQALPDGDLLVSMRNTSAVYLLDPSTSGVIWTLGGRDSSFKLGPRARFAWQHDAKLLQPGDGGLGSDVALTLFNDANGTITGHPSEGMVLRLDTVTHTATLVAAYHHHPALAAVVLGSMQLLPNGNALIGWGSRRYFSEYTKSGRLLLDVQWPAYNQSYRALLTDTWVGRPYYPPRGAARGETVYASWNGATQVARWQVLAGPSTHDLKVVDGQTRTGFETAIRLNKTYPMYEVQALDAHGTAIGTSKPFS
jgi:hypothetical protein